jgi:hypothetical protein
MPISWTPSWRTPAAAPFWLPMRSERLTCPEMTKSGVESNHAPATPVIAFVLPGPDVTIAAPR